MGELADIAVKVIGTTGVFGAVVIAILIALACAVVIYARTADLFTGSKTASQQSEFQAKLLKAVDRLSQIEVSLRGEIDQLQNDKEQLQRALNEGTVAIELMRQQQRRLIDLFREVLAGRRPIDSIDAKELGA